MAFSGVFPNSLNENVSSGELSIVLCGDCSLAQLDRDFPSNEMYGENYGYMSSLNSSMVDHLSEIAHYLEKAAELKQGDVVLDIGSNDGTLLSLYQTQGIIRVGMDPTIVKYKSLYPNSTIAVSEFFSAEAFESVCPGRKAKVVSTVAMLYDLPDPSGFAKQVRQILADIGFWHIEVSYGPWMLESGAFDAVCHEHVEYYSLKTLKRILDLSGFKIAAISFNDTNGGSLSITATPVENKSASEATSDLQSIIDKEDSSGCNELSGWRKFDQLAKSRISDMEDFLISVKADGKRVVGLGASTKGNILLQSLNPEALSAIEVIGEINDFKFGKVTPGTGITIAPENEVINSQPDFIVILPWHFKESFKVRLHDYTKAGGSIVFPLPELEIVKFDGD
jgi:hypothetical protein